MSDFEDFKQVCVWPATLLPEGDSPEDFDKFMMGQFGIRTKFQECIITLPNQDRETGHLVEGTGGRSDLVFRVHNDDVQKFIIKRLAFGISWWEDYSANYREIIPPRFIKKYAS